MASRARRAAAVGGLAVAQYDDLVAEIQARRSVRRDEHRATTIGQPPEQLHQPPLEHRVEPAGRLVEQQHRGITDELEPARGATSLTTRKVPDQSAGLFDETELVEHRHDPLLDRDAGIEAQVGGAAERLAGRETTVDALALWDVAERLDRRRGGLRHQGRATSGRLGDAREHA